MSRHARRTATVLALVFVTFLVPGVSRAGGPGKWTKVGVAYNFADQVGMFRTADGTLLVADGLGAIRALKP